MLYKLFNDFIYNYYFNPNSLSDEIIMSVDENLIIQFEKKYNTTKEKLQESFNEYFSIDWKHALKTGSNHPNFFGIIAIQIFIASQMKDENEELTHRTYNPRLIEYLGMKKDHLNKIYTNYQDKIWQGLKIWATCNNFHISIPEIGSGSGRFIAYPLSHTLLNKEDLKFVPLIFDDISLRPHESIAFIDFQSLLLGSKSDRNQTNHFRRIKNRLERENKIERLFNQIHLYYINEWEGKLPTFNEKGQRPKVPNPDATNNSKILYFNYNDKLIQKASDNGDVQEISLDDFNLFKKTKSYFPFKGENMLLFEKGYYEEWLNTRYLTCKTHIIVCEKHNSYFIDKLGNILNDFSNRLYTIKEVEITNNNSIYFSKAIDSYRVENGLKINRKQWLKNAGPDIFINDNTELRINGIIHSEEKISMKNYGVGVYKIRGSNIKPIEIEIIDSISINIPRPIIDTGWQINKENNNWESTNGNLNINGLSFYFSTNNNFENTQTWIDAITKRKSLKKHKTQNINALKRSRYGI